LKNRIILALALSVLGCVSARAGNTPSYSTTDVIIGFEDASGVAPNDLEINLGPLSGLFASPTVDLGNVRAYLTANTGGTLANTLWGVAAQYGGGYYNGSAITIDKTTILPNALWVTDSSGNAPAGFSAAESQEPNNAISGMGIDLSMQAALGSAGIASLAAAIDAVNDPQSYSNQNAIFGQLSNSFELQGAGSADFYLLNSTSASNNSNQAEGSFTATKVGTFTLSSTGELTFSSSGSDNAPTLSALPTLQSVANGSTVTITASASGTPPFAYQWQFNGSAIAGATNAALDLFNIGTTQAGSYAVVVSNAFGSVTSNAAKVTVTVNSHLYALSSRAYLGTGPDQNIVAGFYTGDASGSKNIVVCGIGPGLGLVFPSLSSETLAVPKLTLINAAQSTLDLNSAWGGGQTLANAIATVYLSPPFYTNPNSTDAAIYTSVPAGTGIGYTAQIDSVNNTAGIALAAIYDFDSYAGTPSSHLTGISTRALVGVDSLNQSLFGGFYIGGTTSQTVLIEAIGPGLAPYVSGKTLAKPVLTLYDSNSNVIATNTGWGNPIFLGNSPVAAGIQPATAAIITSATGSDLLATGSADCAMVVTLPTGSTGLAGYTAKVSSGDSTTGIAMVQIYNVP
jgi:hypothetical protein